MHGTVGGGGAYRTCSNSRGSAGKDILSEKVARIVDPIYEYISISCLFINNAFLFVIGYHQIKHAGEVVVLHPDL